MAEHTMVIDGCPLAPHHVAPVARHGVHVPLPSDALQRMAKARAIVESVAASPSAVYGINTGFGSFAHIRIEGSELRDLQRNLVRSHASGVGEPLPTDVVRAMMLLLAASLARGHSGCRPDV